MATSSDAMCGVCDARHITKVAEQWCPECVEGLCSECLTYHNASKISRNHGIIPVENYKQLPPFISSIVHHCQDHEMKYQMYCPHHESYCCPVCISTTHKKCVDLLAIGEIINSSKTSTLFESIENSLQDIVRNINRAMQDRKQNLTEIKEQRSRFDDEIKQRINTHLDTLEHQLLQDLDAAEEKVKGKIENVLKQLADKLKKTEKLQNDTSSVKNYASDLQTLLGSKAIKAEVEREEKYVHSLSEDGSLDQISFECSINNNLSDILSSITSFGSVSTETSAPTVVLKSETDKQAQIMAVPALPKSINDISLILKKKFDISLGKTRNKFTGCTINTAEKMIFVDYNNERLVIFNGDGILDSEQLLSPSKPCDVTCIDDNRLAVTTEKPNQIQIINIASNSIERTIHTSHYSEGITNRQDKLIYCEYENGIQTVELTGNSITTLVKPEKMYIWAYIAASEDNIYHTNNGTNTVTCYKLNGEKVWEYNNETILKTPYGIAVDKDLNIYVASHDSIVVLSSDGQNARQILSKVDGINKPWAIHFDSERSNLLVVNLNGPAYLYQAS